MLYFIGLIAVIGFICVCDLLMEAHYEKNEILRDMEKRAEDEFLNEQREIRNLKIQMKIEILKIKLNSIRKKIK